jgi:hypothetical protein
VFRREVYLEIQREQAEELLGGLPSPAAEPH